MCTVYLVGVLLLADSSNAVWTPPANPDPNVILEQAVDDAQAERYDEALAKHVWFHEHALEYEPGLYGVRLSFALGYWGELGKIHPPALQKLKEIRASAEAAVRTGKDCRTKFHEMSAVDRALDQSEKTVSTFQALDRDKPDIARQVYDVAEDSLVLTGQYQLCGKYLDAEARIAKILKTHQQVLDASGQFDRKVLKDIANLYVRDAAIAITLVKRNGDSKTADSLAQRVKERFSSTAHRTILDAATEGMFPE